MAVNGPHMGRKSERLPWSGAQGQALNCHVESALARNMVVHPSPCRGETSEARVFNMDVETLLGAADPRGKDLLEWARARAASLAVPHDDALTRLVRVPTFDPTQGRTRPLDVTPAPDRRSTLAHTPAEHMLTGVDHHHETEPDTVVEAATSDMNEVEELDEADLEVLVEAVDEDAPEWRTALQSARTEGEDEVTYAGPLPTEEEPIRRMLRDFASDDDDES